VAAVDIRAVNPAGFDRHPKRRQEEGI